MPRRNKYGIRRGKPIEENNRRLNDDHRMASKWIAQQRKPLIATFFFLDGEGMEWHGIESRRREGFVILLLLFLLLPQYLDDEMK